MSLPDVVSAEQWLAARKELLAQEKQFTRVKDALAATRRELPMVRVEKDYTFEGPDGKRDLPELFAGRAQLIVQHFMFHPDWEDGCPSCTAAVDEISDGLRDHLRDRDTNLVVIARAPTEKIERYRAKRGWTMPIWSSYGSDFNYDFHVTLDESVTPVMFNFRGPGELRDAGFDWMLDTSAQPMEQPGYSCFLRDGDDTFHTYSTFGRGTEQLGGVYGFLDMTALGRQEDWEEPRGRAGSARPAAPRFD
jgi:predicted dithiol-disulfide oxidoreductase (DUF899 family)